MTCEEIKPILADHWSRVLTEEQEIAFEAHLATCDACRAESDRLGAFWENLGLLPSLAGNLEPSDRVRDRFYETLTAYQQGLASAPKQGWRERMLALWPRQPAWQLAMGVALLAVGLGIGYGVRLSQLNSAAGTELAQLRGEVSGMRQLVALSLMQQQSASERLRGVSWAYQVEPPDTEVLTALLAAVNRDPNVNVRLAAVDALHPFATAPGTRPVTREGAIQALARETDPIVQVALIDLLVDLKEKEAARELQRMASDASADAGVRQHAHWALEKLQ